MPTKDPNGGDINLEDCGPTTEIGDIRRNGGDLFARDQFGEFNLRQAAGGAHGSLTGLGSDDHPHYLTTGRHNAIFGTNPHGVTAAEAGADPAGSAAAAGSAAVATSAAALTAHVGAANPHSQYPLTTDLDGLFAAYLDRHHFENEADLPNNTTTFADYIKEDVVLAHVAKYKIVVTFTWSMNSGATDFQARLQVDGIEIDDAIRWEPQDVGGAGDFGTDQRYKGILEGFYINDTAGATRDIDFDFNATTTNDNAAIYRANLSVERYI